MLDGYNVINFKRITSGNNEIVIAYVGNVNFVGDFSSPKSLNSFVNNNKMNILSCASIDVNNFMVVEYSKKTEKEKEDIFNKIFTQELQKFNERTGIEQLQLISLIVLQSKQLENIRIFYQLIYNINDKQKFEAINRQYEEVKQNLKNQNTIVNISNVLGCDVKSNGHIDVLTVKGNNFLLFDTQTRDGYNPFLIAPLYDNTQKLLNYEIQGQMSCFLMCLSYLRLIEKNEHFKNNLENYFKIGIGQLLIVEELFNLINPNNKLLKIEFNQKIVCCHKIKYDLIITKNLNDNNVIILNGTQKQIKITDLINTKNVNNIIDNLKNKIIKNDNFNQCSIKIIDVKPIIGEHTKKLQERRSNSTSRSSSRSSIE